MDKFVAVGDNGGLTLGYYNATDLPEGRRINQMDVPCHERAKGGFRASRGVGGYEFAIRRYRCHSTS